MRPSKTRLERQAPLNPYLSEMELKQALEIQAAEKRKAHHLSELQEKAELLKHYENYAIGNQNSTDEDLHNFLEKKKEEFDGLDEDFYQAQELFNKKPEFNIKKLQKNRLELNDYENVNDFIQMQSKPEKVLSQGEIDRQKRLKLREDERMRRLHGITNSAYDVENGKLTFEQQQNIKHFNQKNNPETPKNEIYRVNDINKIKGNDENDNRTHVFNEKFSKNAEIIHKVNDNNERIAKKSGVYETQKSLPSENVEEFFVNNQKKPLQNENLEKLNSREKQMKYRDELDRQIALKQKEKDEFKKPRATSAQIEEFQPRNLGQYNSNLEQNISPQNKYNQNNNFNNNDNNNQRPKTVIENAKEAELDKKKKYADELWSQINEKKQQKFNENQPSTKQTKQNEENNDFNQAKLMDIEKKKKYRDELTYQIQQKNDQKLDKDRRIDFYHEEKNENKLELQNYRNEQNINNKPMGSFENNYPEKDYNNNQNNLYEPQINYPSKKITRGVSNQEVQSHGVAFVNKMEAEIKDRENKRKDMKLNYQEDLKRQIDEKKRMKELENLRFKEEEAKELEKIEKDRLQMLQEEPQKTKGRKPLNSIMAQTFEKKDENDNNQRQIQEVNEEDYQNKRTEIYEENQENFENKNVPFIPRKRENHQIYDNPSHKQEYPESPQGSLTQNQRPQRSVNRSESRSNNEKYVTYEEFDRQTKALKEAIEEKLRIEKLTNEEEGILKEYKVKIKEIFEEKKRHEMEIDKLRNLLENHFSHEKQVDLDFLSKALRGEQEPLFREESKKVLKGIQSHLRESMYITESLLPTNSNLIYGGHNLEQSFMKDLEVFKAIHWDYFLHESQFIEDALQKPGNPQNEFFNMNEANLHKNPMAIQQTNLGELDNDKFQMHDKFQMPLIQPQSQRLVKTPKLFQSLLRSNTQETPKVLQLETEFEQNMVASEEKGVLKEVRVFQELKTPKPSEQDHLNKFLMEESEAQSVFVNSNNLDERRLPTPMQKKIHEEEENYENEGFESDEHEKLENENEIQMNEAKFNNEEKSLVLADEELDEAAVEKFIESNENQPFEIKPVNLAKMEINSSTNSKIARFKKPKTFDVFGKIQNTNYTNEDEKESIQINRAEKVMNRLETYLDEVDREDGRWEQSIRKN